jgi:hypothetical protein
MRAAVPRPGGAIIRSASSEGDSRGNPCEAFSELRQHEESARTAGPCTAHFRRAVREIEPTLITGVRRRPWC